MKISNLFLSLIAITGCSGISYAEKPAHPAPHWEYEGEAGAANWGGLDESFHLCEEGKAQSPFDIKESIEADLPPITFAYRPFSPQIVNNGHTIQVNVPQGSSIQVGRDIYQLLQFHFHTPSEYQVDSNSYPLEVHFVHKRTDGALGVVGVMFAEGVANEELGKIWKNIPYKAGQEKNDSKLTLDITKLLPAGSLYYRFMGSLTTPPCSEGVNWHVMQQPISASKEQIDAFRKIYPMNARPLQPANNRLIVKDDK